ncbi:unnamed protein product [Ilex paraguariensis]|uniref:Bifunctional inhibitor/plant lipid transfer protein/seed storage helical domain-containing protein n=1 Tax=Ilex paraguariensis TaxID=185542 RepID=A0ABC8RU35_9AQUA
MSTKFPSSTILSLLLNILFFAIVSGQASKLDSTSATMPTTFIDNNASQLTPGSAPPASMGSNSSPLMPVFGSPPPLMAPNCTCSIKTKRLAICSLPLYSVPSRSAKLACCIQLRFLRKAKARSCICKAIKDKILWPVVPSQADLLLLTCGLKATHNLH